MEPAVFDEDWPSLTRSVHSSLQSSLRVNLPREIMGFTDFPFDDKFEGSKDKRRYCGHEEVEHRFALRQVPDRDPQVNRYLKAFVRYFDLEQFVQFESEVVNVEVSEKSSVKWNVEVMSAGKTNVSTEGSVPVWSRRRCLQVHEFDAVVVSNGQYSIPNIPDIKNIDKFENPCVHSHLYRDADFFEGKTVAVHGQ